MIAALDIEAKTALPLNRVLAGDCVEVMAPLPASSVDFVLTDPPYLVDYRSRDGQRIANDDNARWLRPAFEQIYRLMKDGTFCVSFYGWQQADLFIAAWRAAGFRLVGHIVFRKRYASSKRFLRYHHEQAYLLAKGFPEQIPDPMPDVVDWRYTGNRLHPTQKPVDSLAPLIKAFCPVAGVVLDPFCGSGSSLIAAHQLGRAFLGIELDPIHHRTATDRLSASEVRFAA